MMSSVTAGTNCSAASHVMKGLLSMMYTQRVVETYWHAKVCDSAVKE